MAHADAAWRDAYLRLVAFPVKAIEPVTRRALLKEIAGRASVAIIQGNQKMIL